MAEKSDISSPGAKSPPQAGQHRHEFWTLPADKGSHGLIPAQRLDFDVGRSITRVAEATPGDVQRIAASQIELLSAYYNEVIRQARSSFQSALVAAGIGLAFFIASVVFLLLQQTRDVAIISLVAGTITEVIAGLNFYLYGKASGQFADFQSRLERTQRFLLANSVIESLGGTSKEKARLELVRIIADVAREGRPAKSQVADGATPVSNP